MGARLAARSPRLGLPDQCPVAASSNVIEVKPPKFAGDQQGDRPMSQFLYLYRMTDSARQDNMGTPERAQQSMQRWMAWMNDLDKKGHLKDRGQPLERTGKVVRGQQKTVTDGPFTEAKDLVGGFTLVEARDIDQAVELSRGCPILEGGGSVEVRPVMKMDM
jgi:hypothetical protein